MNQRTYINESHRRVSEACQKEVEEMSKHPLSHEDFIAQCLRNRAQSYEQEAQEFGKR